MTNYTKNGTRATRLACAVLFLLFTFLYLYDYQADILSVIQHVLSKGVTHYDKTVGAILITLVLWLLQSVIATTTRLRFFYALTYIPSLLLLGILTDVTSNVDHESYIGNWYWAFPLMMMAYGFLIWVCKQYETIQTQFKGNDVIRRLWMNIAILVCMCLVTCMVGNNDAMFHYRMRMENNLKDNNPDMALQVGSGEEKTDSSLAFLRLWSLSRKRQLGEHMFEYPLMGKSDVMLPNHNSVKLLMISERQFYKEMGGIPSTKMVPIKYFSRLLQTRRANPVARDWLLGAYLMDGNLDAFASTLPKFYKVDSLLPKHYQEALTLYNHVKSHPVIVYRDPILEADYDDYQKLKQDYRDSKAQYTMLHDSYGKTYWFYYYRLQHNKWGDRCF